ncbi:P-loop containing nucleoside triphosphate hydrolase protein [Dioscorea alata]|uniref:P-loop containing nucleoside triphosphate hydrolase protein n=1 Tax=Dioscorea alata TaxID=55571 RepID=A0ACB7UZM5_DIOAL|nr:P-loop containing nucleoside triphosphate hydrolase protein [Dioscorea alata]
MAKFSSSSSSSSSSTFHSTIQSPSTPLIINPTDAPTSHMHSDEKNLGDISMQFGKARCCDVFIGSCVILPWEMHFVKWLRAELKMQGFSCSLSDRSRLRDARSLAVARATMDATAVGMVVVTTRAFSNPYSVEELQVFLESGKLIPIFLGLTQSECLLRDIMERRGNLWEKHGGPCWTSYGGVEKEWMEVINGLSRVDVKLEVKEDNMRSCILVAVRILGTILGRKSTVERVRRWVEFAEEEFPFPRNTSFVGREKELLELESLLFGEIMKTSSDQNPSLTEERVGHEISEDVPRKGKGPVVWQDSDGDDDDDKIELQFQNGLALVTGDSGIGKTELLLEFAYRFSQRYKMVLWLLPLLGVDIDVVAENELSLGKQGGVPKKFADMEGEAIGKVRRELMRDIPFLLVIDNLEKDEDWWDGRNVMELLPRLGGETHVLISTRLPHALNIRPQKLLHLSSSEAMLLMKGSLGDLPVEDIDALRAIEEKLGRLPLALGLVGAVLAELQISPCKLLDKINGMPYRQLPRSGNKEDLMLRRNSFLVKLLDFCFSIFYQTEKPKKLALRMIQSSSWFAPSPFPVSMLALAGKDISEGSLGSLLWKICRRRLTCMCTRQPNNVKSSEDELADIMVRLRIARSCTKIGCIYVHDIIKLYARNTDNSYNAHAVVQAISTEGSIQEHSDHAWAACFLVFKFGNTPSVVDLSVQGMVSFIKRIVLPLAMQDLRAFSQYTCVLELLRVATEALETMEDLLLPDGDSSSNKSPAQFDPHWYNEFAHLRATLLESRAKLMIRGGLYDIAEQLCRTTLNIKEVMCGWEHPDTQATRQMIEKLIRLQSNF